jgi:hypothetical protein
MRRTDRRTCILAAYYVTARRFGLRDVLVRAEKIRVKLKIGKAFMCTCVLNEEGKRFHALLNKDAQGAKHLFRTTF